MRHDNGSAVTIGAYDGIHIGHRQVIELVRRRAADAGLRSVVVTFDKNPAAVVNPASAPPRLTDIDLKLELLSNTGVDQILVLKFDAERAKETAEDFVNEVLVDELAARVVVVGDDFHFGNKRRGNVALLREMGEQAGFTVEPVHLVSDEWAHEVVSSTRIRALIARGELAEAESLLCRPHEVRGRVVETAVSPPRAGPEDGTGAAGGPGDDVTDHEEHLLVVEIPAEILLPPAGEYAGFVVAGAGDGTVPARIDVFERASTGPQRLSVKVGPSGDAPTPMGTQGEAVRVRFG